MSLAQDNMTANTAFIQESEELWADKWETHMESRKLQGLETITTTSQRLETMILVGHYQNQPVETCRNLRW